MESFRHGHYMSFQTKRAHHEALGSVQVWEMTAEPQLVGGRVRDAAVHLLPAPPRCAPLPRQGSSALTSRLGSRFPLVSVDVCPSDLVDEVVCLCFEA